MYVFDVLCTTFCLLSLWCFARERWVLSFIAFWLAYKSKELAVMLPVVLAAYEFWFGKQRWKPLAPFFLVSLSFGLQGMWGNPNKDNDYTFRFTADALARTSAFYASRVFLLPYLGFVVPAFALFARNRRTWFGLAMLGLFLVPMSFSPRQKFQRVLLSAVHRSGNRLDRRGGGGVRRGTGDLSRPLAAPGSPGTARPAARNAVTRCRDPRLDGRRAQLCRRRRAGGRLRLFRRSGGLSALGYRGCAQVFLRAQRSQDYLGR